MSNSPLVNYTKISPNSTNPRERKITKITIHHVAGKVSVESLGEQFFPVARQGSSNYGIGSDGRVGMYVEEKNRAWTSGDWDNDHSAITIETSNDGGAPDWHVSDKVLAKLIDLCVDICRRNGIAKLNYTGDKNGNLTRHNMFMATACPGKYLQSKFPYIAEQVNIKLGAGGVVTPTKPEVELYKVKIISNVGLNYRPSPAGQPVLGQYPYGKTVSIYEESGEWGRTDDGVWICIKPVYVQKVLPDVPTVPQSKLYEVKIIEKTGLNYRTGAGTSFTKKGQYKYGDVVPIYEEKNGWGKTDKGYWISLSTLYVQKITPTTPPVVTPPPVTQPELYKVKIIERTGLNYRTGAGTGFTKMGQYKYGDVVPIHEEKNNWGKTDKGYWISLNPLYIEKVVDIIQPVSIPSIIKDETTPPAIIPPAAVSALSAIVGAVKRLLKTRDRM
jgi:hypothetical protein